MFGTTQTHAVDNQRPSTSLLPHNLPVAIASGVCMPKHTLSPGLCIMKTAHTYNAAMEASCRLCKGYQEDRQCFCSLLLLLCSTRKATFPLSLPCCCHSCQSSIQPSQRQAHRGSHRALAVPSWEHLLSSSPRTSPPWLGAYHLRKPTRVPGEETQLLESHSASQKEIKKQELAGLIRLGS